MKLKALALVLALTGFGALSGCETMSAEECASADWAQLGYGDADSNGADRFNQRAEACADKGFAADASAYRRGFEDGLRSFCQPQRAFAFARRGGGFNGSCPAELDADFRYAMADGGRVHDLQEDIDAARSAVSSAESRRREIDRDLRDRENELERAETDEERARLRGEIDRLRRERRDVNDDLRIAQEQTPRLERAMSALRYEIGDRWGPW